MSNSPLEVLVEVAPIGEVRLQKQGQKPYAQRDNQVRVAIYYDGQRVEVYLDDCVLRTKAQITMPGHKSTMMMQADMIANGVDYAVAEVKELAQGAPVNFSGSAPDMIKTTFEAIYSKL